MTLRLLPILVLAIGGLIASLGTLTAAPADAPGALPALQTTAQLTQTAVAALTQTAAVPTATSTVSATATGTGTATPIATATVSPTPTPTPTATPTATPTPAVLPDLTIAKFDLADPVAPGDLLTYTITVTNSIASGPPSNPSTVTDEIPAGTVFSSASGLGCTTVGSMVSCSVPPLAPGQSQVYSIVLQVTGASGTTITNLARVDEPANLVIELNETNNTAVATTLISGPTPLPTSTPLPTATPVPTEPTPVPPEPTPLPPALTTVLPPATGTVWARILLPTQTFSTTDSPLWGAQPGELYWVMLQEGGWILGVWEGDTRAWAVWFRADGVQLLTLDRLPPPEPGPPAQVRQLWLVVFRPVQTYSLTMAPLWVARPGEWYLVVRREDGWTLGRWEGDPPDFVVWIPEGPQIEFASA